MQPLQDLAVALPEAFLIVAGLVLLAVGCFREAQAARLVTLLTVLVLVVTMVVVLGGGAGPVQAFGGHFVVDAFSSFLKLLILAGAALVVILSPSYLRREAIDRFEYPLLALFSTAGMLMMVSANSFLALYMALELHSLPLYVLAAFQRDTVRSSEAGLKYFVLGALASGMLLYGCSLVYGFTGTVGFGPLGERVGAGEGAALPLGALVGMVFIAAGLAFKLAAVPFHMWTPDVYEGAPTSVTAFLATAPKVAAIGLTMRVFHEPFGAWVADWQQIVVFISVASMLLGVFAALMQANIKRLMAYSGISHMGFALVGLAAGTERGVWAVLVYTAIYLVMTLGTFAVILAMRKQGRSVENIADLSGLARTQPMLAAATAVFMFSLAGIPPLAGFFGKLYVFLAAVDAGMTPLAIIGLLATVVGAYYYTRIVKIMYFDEAHEPLDQPVGREVAVISAVTALMLLLFVLFPGPLLRGAEAAAAALFL